ncbi:MAG: 50S ribosomal protein L11 [Spirochaetia bacterium]|nr:50S ribosomal protein L11 [Spirochaetota bacterium]MCX8096367.1 50S ribosomal protein L11 [Spirochaetota bacterium]MDW8113049.1 50S ribosomal protein L11 [Spirochaetia bacterium]
MPKKEVKAVVKLQIPSGEATPAPPVGPALGQHGVPIMDFVKKFNEATASQKGLIVPVVITVYTDRTYEFVVKTPPTSVLIKKELGIDKGSSSPNLQKVGRLTKDQVRKIAQIKLPDTNADSIEAVERMVIGTARNMGVEVEE